MERRQFIQGSAAKVLDAYNTSLRDIGGWQKIAEIEYCNKRNRVLGI